MVQTMAEPMGIPGQLAIVSKSLILLNNITCLKSNNLNNSISFHEVFIKHPLIASCWTGSF